MFAARQLFIRLSVCTILLTVVANADPVKIAVTPFHAESDSPLVAQTGADYAMMFFTGALEVEEVEMVERDPGSPLWDELRRGEGDWNTAWAGADIVVRGRMESTGNFNPLFPYRIKVEIVDVTNAAILNVLTLEKNRDNNEKSIGLALLEKAPSLLRDALKRHGQLKKAPRVVPLFFTNRSPNDRLENYELDFKSIVKETLGSNDSQLEPLFFGGSEEAIEEQTLNWLGFTEEDRSGDWKNVADYFIWGEFSEVESDEFQAPGDVQVKATIQWLGRDETTGEVNGSFRIKDFKEGVARLVESLPDAPVPPGDSPGTGTSKRISDLLFERALPLLYDDLRETLTGDPKTEDYLTNRFKEVENDYAKELIFASCLFDPIAPRKQFAFLHFSEGSRNPVFNARIINRIETWLARASRVAPEKRMPRAAAANLLEERIRLSRHSWWKPARYPSTPVASYQTEDSIERFLRLMDTVTRNLGEDNVQEARTTGVKIDGRVVSKSNGYADRFASSILFDLVASKWMSTEHKARLFELAWRLVPEGERADFLTWKKEQITRLADEVGTAKWEAIVKSPALVVTRDETGASRPANTAMPDSPSKDQRRRFTIPAKPAAIRQSFRDRFRLSRSIHEDFRREGFVGRSVRQITPHQIVIEGKLEGRKDLPPWHNYAMVNDPSGSNREFAWAFFGRSAHPFLQGERSNRNHRRLVEVPALFHTYRRQQWSSDRKWAVRLDSHVDDSRTVDTSSIDLFRLIKIDPRGKEIEDLSPPDLNLIKNTTNRVVLVEDRWIVLIGFGEHRFEINRLDLSTGKWLTGNISIPDFAGNPHLDEKLYDEGAIVPCGKWIFIARRNSGVLFNVESGKTFPHDPLYDRIVQRELARIRRSLENEALDEAELKRTIDQWKFSIEGISVTGDQIYLLHTGGIAGFTPPGLESGNLEMRHLDFREQSVTFKTGGEISWRGAQGNQCLAEVGSHWIWLVSETACDRFFIIDREKMTLIGSVDLEGRVPRWSSEMFAVGDSVFLSFEGKRKKLESDGAPIPTRILTRFSLEDLLKVARAPAGSTGRRLPAK